MKRADRRLLEEKLCLAVMDEMELEPERDAEILAQVKAAYEQQQQEKSQDANTSGGRQHGRHAIAIVVAAMLFVVFSFGLTIFMPESVSHARSFARRAAIWVNDKLHLGYDFEVPLEELTQQAGQDATYISFEEAAENIPYPLVYLNDASLELQSIEVHYSADLPQVSIFYRSEAQCLCIVLTPVGEDALTSLDIEADTFVSWQCGEFACWDSEPNKCAFTYYSSMEIDITGENMSYDTFLSLCETISVLNQPTRFLFE